MGEVEVHGVVEDVALKYSLMEIGVHSRSEHTVDGVRYPLEMQMTHVLNRDYAGFTRRTRLVVGVLFQQAEGADEHNADYGENKFLKQLNLDTLEVITNVSVHLNDFMKERSQKFYFYEGSLTKPGCDETAYWVIVEELQYCSKAQIDTVRRKVDDNYREVQPLNGRTVYRTVEPEKVGSFRLVCIIVVCALIVLIILNWIQLTFRSTPHARIHSAKLEPYTLMK